MPRPLASRVFRWRTSFLPQRHWSQQQHQNPLDRAREAYTNKTQQGVNFTTTSDYISDACMTEVCMWRFHSPSLTSPRSVRRMLAPCTEWKWQTPKSPYSDITPTPQCLSNPKWLLTHHSKMCPLDLTPMWHNNGQLLIQHSGGSGWEISCWLGIWTSNLPITSTLSKPLAHYCSRDVKLHPYTDTTP